MDSGASRPWSDELAEVLGRLGVSKTVEQLRREMEDLIERLAEAEREAQPGGPAAARPGSSGLNAEIENVGQKVDQASAMLANLTELLEAQAERIEMLENRFGRREQSAEPTCEAADEGETAMQRYRRRLYGLEEKLAAVLEAQPDAVAAYAPAVAGQSEAGPARPLVEPPTCGAQLAAIESVLAALDRRFDQFSTGVQARLEELSERLDSAENGSGSKDQRIEELEERLLIMVEATGKPRASEGDPLCRPELSGDAEPAGPLELAAPPSADTVGPGAADRLAGLEKIIDRELRVREQGIEGVDRSGPVDAAKEHPTVMVVDSGVDARTILSMYLSRTGFQVVTAASAEDCLAKLRYHDVDAIVLDAALPGADGGHVCRVLRNEEAYASKRATPVIVYTGYPDEYTRKLVAQWRADDYVVKGGDMLPLMTSLIRYTRGPQAARA